MFLTAKDGMEGREARGQISGEDGCRFPDHSHINNCETVILEQSPRPQSNRTSQLSVSSGVQSKTSGKSPRTGSRKPDASNGIHAGAMSLAPKAGVQIQTRSSSRKDACHGKGRQGSACEDHASGSLALTRSHLNSCSTLHVSC